MERVSYNIENKIPSTGLRVANVSKYFKSNKKSDKELEKQDNMRIKTEDAGDEGNDLSMPEVQDPDLGSKYFRALNKVYFEVKKGELLSILGHNGAGKSTLINIIIGLLSCTEGDVYIKGQNTRDYIEDIYQTIGICP